MRYAGWGFEPDLRDGAAIDVRGGLAPRPGDLALCNRSGQGDLLRLLARRGDDAWLATIDGYPLRRAVVQASNILGVVTAIDGRRPTPTLSLLACRAWFGAACLAVRRIASAPVWSADASDTVLEKYARQAPAYRDGYRSNLAADHLRIFAAHLPAGGRVLVAGCGVGREALHLAELGYRVVGFDALPVMVAAAGALAREAGLDARFVVADARAANWPAGPYHAAYLTPLLYSFLWGSGRRVEFLRRIGESIGAEGCVLYSVRLHPGLRSWLETRLAWCRVSGGDGSPHGEPGDWYTRYLAPEGTIGTSFLARFSVEEVIREARRAGFRSVGQSGSHFTASRYVPL
jgi:SAM-dependent methyltransferase